MRATFVLVAVTALVGGLLIYDSVTLIDAAADGAPAGMPAIFVAVDTLLLCFALIVGWKMKAPCAGD